MIIDGERVYACTDCLDTGWVSAVDPVCWPKSIRTVAVVCLCQRGDAIVEARAKHKRRKVARTTARTIIHRPGMNRADVEKELELIRQLPVAGVDEYVQSELDF